MMHLLRAVIFALLLSPAWTFASEPININTADAVTLEQLKGIGPAKATAIVDYRNEHGPFASTADLSMVPGIGVKTVELIAGDITTDGE